MFSVAFLLCFLGFYCWYLSSKRVKQSGSKFQKWMNNRPNFTKVTGSIFLIISCMLLVKSSGVGAGIFLFFIVLMSLASLTILLVPLRIFRYPLILATFLILLFTEIFLF
ncbi:MAG: DUF3325 family protein [Bacteroidota bacterium]|nr:DUF3325 family protein [Christiangramia flava]MAM18363.1 DUF3325 domain-containing protein [Christiangramia sp.]MEE2772407.1 DUF3325 family protein [Bacteroidota bacterium]|tara:strand:- start:263 stop:592 length:330 start_codon:yes stop_codon:yes gene_type:complete